jgi:Zn-dependent metalloprotease
MGESSRVRFYSLDEAPRAFLSEQSGPSAVEPRMLEFAQNIHQAVKAASTNSQDEPDPLLRRRLDALDQLRKNTDGKVDVLFLPGGNTPRMIRGSKLHAPAKRAMPKHKRGLATAREFLQVNRRMMGLIDPDHELTLRREWGDDTGRRHYRFAQFHQGIPVWPAEMTIHLAANGHVNLMNGACVPSPRNFDVEPLIQADEARRLAQLAVPDGANAEASTPELIIHALDSTRPRLAWKLRVKTGPASRWLVVVDTSTGETLTAFNEIMDGAVQGSGVDLFNDRRDLDLWESESEGLFFMVDTSKPMFDPLSAPPSPISTIGGIIIMDALNDFPFELSSLAQVTSPDKVSWSDPHAVSASFSTSEAYDFFLEAHGWDSFDGEGSTIIAVIHLGQDFFNAFWDGQAMYFGDAAPFPRALDVVTHELAHGVTQHTANLIYQNQSGALNESFSDIFGESAEARTRGAPDWLAGGDLGRAFRSLADPSSLTIPGTNRSFPSKMSEMIPPNDPIAERDNGGVHYNSSIINHAFYLLAEGLEGAIGIEAAGRIFFRALSTHLVARSQFIDARLACIQSAEELFGSDSVEAQKTGEAFDAVEIFDGAPTPPPPQFPAIAGPDSTLFIRFDPDRSRHVLYRREDMFDDPEIGDPLSFLDVASARPAVSGNGELAVYVNPINDACFTRTSGSLVEDCSTLAGLVFSVAMTPDASVYGFVMRDETGNPRNSIRVIDLETFTDREIPLRAPLIDGESDVEVAFARTMDFTTDGQTLIYDAFNRTRFDDDGDPDTPPVESGNWSVYAIDLNTDTVLSLAPPIVGVDIAFPALSQTSDGFVTFDVFDSETDESTVTALDLNTGESTEIATVVGGFGAPGYTGADSAIIYSRPDSSPTGASLMRQELEADSITPVGEPATWIPDGHFGVIYRRGDLTSEQGDADEDGIQDGLDNCPDHANPDQADGDEDGAGDACDLCPEDSGKVDPGFCGCGSPDEPDSDGDGAPDCSDECPTDPRKSAPGGCGCGTPDRDSDGDGELDCLDGCPDDPDKIDRGACGCFLPDIDSDGDGTADCQDECPGDADAVSVDAQGQCQPTSQDTPGNTEPGGAGSENNELDAIEELGCGGGMPCGGGSLIGLPAMLAPLAYFRYFGRRKRR